MRDLKYSNLIEGFNIFPVFQSISFQKNSKLYDFSDMDIILFSVCIIEILCGILINCSWCDNSFEVFLKLIVRKIEVILNASIKLEYFQSRTFVLYYKNVRNTSPLGYWGNCTNNPCAHNLPLESEIETFFHMKNLVIYPKTMLMKSIWSCRERFKDICWFGFDTRDIMILFYLLFLILIYTKVSSSFYKK